MASKFKFVSYLLKSSRLISVNAWKHSLSSIGTQVAYGNACNFSSQSVTYTNTSKAWHVHEVCSSHIDEAEKEDANIPENMQEVGSTNLWDSSPEDGVDNRYLFEPFIRDKTPQSYGKDTFQYLFENSKFVEALDPIGNEVEGEVIAVEEEKLYVDFGCKFHAVVECRDKGAFPVGTKVIIHLDDLEAIGQFLGESTHHSLLEAQATLVRPLVANSQK